MTMPALALDPLNEPNPYSFVERCTRELVSPSTPSCFLICAAWWDFEADRGGSGSADARWYAANMRAAAIRRLADPATRWRLVPWTPGYDAPTARVTVDEVQG